MTCAMCGFDYRYSQMRKIKWPLLDEKGTSSVSRPSGNLATNGGFESETTGWTAGNSATLAADSDNERTGTYCLKITENGADGPKAQQNVTVVAGQRLHFSCYAKGGTETEAFPFLWDASNNAYLDYATVTCTTSAWTRQEFEVIIPTGCTTMTVVLQNQASNGEKKYLYYDDVELYQITGVSSGYEKYSTILRDTPEGMYVCPKCYDGNHPRNIERKLRKKETLKYPS